METDQTESQDSPPSARLTGSDADSMVATEGLDPFVEGLTSYDCTTGETTVVTAPKANPQSANTQDNSDSDEEEGYFDIPAFLRKQAD